MEQRSSCAIPRLAIVGAGSGSGKTVVTCALLMALQNRGGIPAAYKAGPDYIDPMFHSRVLGVPSRNLDLFLCGEETVRYLFAHNAAGKDIAIIEGVMGLYDGLGAGDEYSSNHLARLTATPEILVIAPKGQGLSLVAQLYGYLHFLPNTIRGVIFNQTSERMHRYYQELVEKHLGLRSYGYLPILPQGRIEGRKLGLATPQTIENLQSQLHELGLAAEKTLDIDGLLHLAADCPPVHYPPVNLSPVADVALAVARDEAFCFYYEDSLDLLRRLGATLIPFSPLHDAQLPKGISGIVLGGGFPENFARPLSENRVMTALLHAAMKKGMPLMAEGGGFLYLCQSLTTAEGKTFPLVGGIEAQGKMTTSLQRFGYCTLKAHKDNMMCTAGETIRAHEYHYGETTDNGGAFMAQKMNGASWPCIHATASVFAGFPQTHLWGNLPMAANFVKACAAYQRTM